MLNLHVKCDACTWRKSNITEDELRSWHNKMCPACGESIIITNEDLQLFESMQQMIQGLKSLGLEVVDESQEEELVGLTVGLKVDSAVLRKKGDSS